LCILGIGLVMAGATGLEPAASCVTGQRFEFVFGPSTVIRWIPHNQDDLTAHSEQTEIC
jgi:hypothetical protein